MNIIEHIPKDLVNFILVALFSFLFGIEQRLRHQEYEGRAIFGTDRTFTLIGILGFVLYYVDPSFRLYLLGAGILGVLFSIFYWHKAVSAEKYGITSIVVALLTYFITPLVYKAEPWLVMLMIVLIIFLVESKETLSAFSRKFDKYEFTTLAKFIIIIGVILPLLPNEPLIPDLDITPYTFWLAIVAVSTISYLSYLLKKFVFPNAGIFLTAILGGMYSSTATTVILSRKSKGQMPTQVAGAIILATSVKYIRIWILALIFNYQVAKFLLPYFFILFVLSIILSILIIYKDHKIENIHIDFKNDRNPLEFKTALIFGILFSFFAILTHYVLKNYGDIGMSILSFIVGITDIDPFLLSIFQSGHSMGTKIIVMSTILATTSNNLAKMTYAIILGDKKIRKYVVFAFLILFIVSLLMVSFVYFFK